MSLIHQGHRREPTCDEPSQVRRFKDLLASLRVKVIYTLNKEPEAILAEAIAWAAGCEA